MTNPTLESARMRAQETQDQADRAHGLATLHPGEPAFIGQALQAQRVADRAWWGWADLALALAEPGSPEWFDLRADREARSLDCPRPGRITE